MNSDIIEHPDYYRLDDGTQLEDAMYDIRLDGPTWSGVKYLWRAGKKDGESEAKDFAKAMHFAMFLAKRNRTDPKAEIDRFADIVRGISRWHSGVHKLWRIVVGEDSEVCASCMKEHNPCDLVVLVNHTIQIYGVYNGVNHYEVDLDDQSVDWLSHVADKTWCDKALVHALADAGRLACVRFNIDDRAWSYDEELEAVDIVRRHANAKEAK